MASTPSSTTSKGIVAYTVVKDEAWIIRHTLQALAPLVDDIIVVDDGSTDGTPDIAEKCDKVSQVVRLHKRAWREVDNRNLALRLAQKYNPEWLIMVDADEMFDATLAADLPELLRSAAEAGSGELLFPYMSLWRGIRRYRSDKPEKFSRPKAWRFVRNVPTLRWDIEGAGGWKRAARYLTGRVRPWGFQGAAVLKGLVGPGYAVSNHVLLHFHFVDFELGVKRQMRYAILFKQRNPRQSVNQVVDWCYQNLNEEGLELSQTSKHWFLDSVWTALSTDSNPDAARLKGGTL